MLNTIDSKTFKKMFLAGAKNLESKKEWINDLNVFPVPDGDTGTNMTLTLMSAVKELDALDEDASILEVGKKISSGTLKGARGNSGVILSQLCRGFVKELENAGELDVEVFVTAFERAQITAYKAVMKPKEGTILTVAKGIAKKAAETAKQKNISLNDFFINVIEDAEEVLAQTPEMLPVLKEAGVVDSGGQGLLEFIKGAYDAYIGKDVDLDFSDTLGQLDNKTPAPVSAGKTKQKKPDVSKLETSDIRFGYCTEFIINTENRFTSKEEQTLKKYLSMIGDSLVCVSMDDIVKIHVHTNDPGLALQKGLVYGSLSNIKIDNMREEHNEILFKEKEDIETSYDDQAEKEDAVVIDPLTDGSEVNDTDLSDHDNENAEAEPESVRESSSPRKEYGFVAVCSGEGLKKVFLNMSVDEVIEGGQTMNPSTEDVVQVINKINADNVFVLPNNGNVIMACEQAKYICSDKNIVVIPTKTIAQGITAVINYVPAMSIEENEEHMKKAIGSIKTAEITYAVRDTTISDNQITKGDYMGLGDGGILAVGADAADVAFESIKKMFDDDSEIATIYYGADATEEDARIIAEKVENEFEDAEVDIVYGGQPVYNYIVSVE